ncbi:hypothetical protein BH09DEP1_BH09DEP1_6920 [soil metagenome]
MKRLLFIVLILASGAQAAPKSVFTKILASAGLSGLALYFSNCMSPSYGMKKESMIAKRIEVPKSPRPVNFYGFHTVINADNDIYDYKLSLPTDLNLYDAAQAVGNAYISCTRASKQHQHECSLEQLHINKKYRYSGLGSVLLQEAIADITQRTTAQALDFVAHASDGTDQARLCGFYERHGAKRKMNAQVQNAFTFNLRQQGLME